MITAVVVNGPDGRLGGYASRLRDSADIRSREVTESPLARPCDVRPDGALAILASGELPEPDLARLAGLTRMPDGRRRGGLIAVVPPPTTPGAGDELATTLRAGAWGFLFAGSPREEVVTAVRAVADGHPFVPPTFLTDLALVLLPIAVRRSGAPQEAGRPLTPRERMVLGLLALGCPNEEIAEKLVITSATVRSHVLSILRKLSVRNRTEAVFVAYKQGILGPNHRAAPAVGETG